MPSYRITPYERKYRRQALDLLFEGSLSHIQLDWYQVGEWLTKYPKLVRLAWDDTSLIGCIGVSYSLHQTAWIRLLGIETTHFDLIKQLWRNLCIDLQAEQIHTVCILVTDEWIIPYIKLLEFEYLEEIVTFQRSETALVPTSNSDYIIRPGTLHDVEKITDIDHTAFIPPWQLDYADIRQAQRYASNYSVATSGEEIIGYQISTRHRTNGHLARLAVAPDYQGNGVGKFLVGSMIRNMQRRGIQTITVNTQRSNIRSQKLYEGYGFRMNGYDLQVWKAEV